MHYDASSGNHNTPNDSSGNTMGGRFFRYDLDATMPQMVHLGFASRKENRLAKNRYYVERGEGVTDHRAWYVDSRAAFENWLPEHPMPRGVNVLPYQGPVPEVFREVSSVHK